MDSLVAYKFVSHDIPSLNEIRENKEFPIILKDKVLSGEQLTREEKDRLFAGIFSSSYSKKGIALHGWLFDFSEVLTPYYVEFDWGSIEKYYAPDKTSIRSHLSGVRKITEIK